MANNPISVGGQAVIEGVMMRSPSYYATAVRTPQGRIVIQKNRFVAMTHRFRFLNIPVIRGDSEQLMTVIQNLVHNAVKFGRENTEVRVGIRVTEGQTLAVSVTDRGEGISAQHVPRLTERFYRVDTARSRKAGGTGLGLSIVKHLVAAHGGQVGIESELGTGTTVWFTIPDSATGDRFRNTG